MKQKSTFLRKRPHSDNTCTSCLQCAAWHGGPENVCAWTVARKIHSGRAAGQRGSAGEGELIRNVTLTILGKRHHLREHYTSMDKYSSMFKDMVTILSTATLHSQVLHINPTTNESNLHPFPFTIIIVLYTTKMFHQLYLLNMPRLYTFRENVQCGYVEVT